MVPPTLIIEIKLRFLSCVSLSLLTHSLGCFCFHSALSFSSLLRGWAVNRQIAQFFIVAQRQSYNSANLDWVRGSMCCKKALNFKVISFCRNPISLWLAIKQKPFFPISYSHTLVQLSFDTNIHWCRLLLVHTSTSLLFSSVPSLPSDLSAHGSLHSRDPTSVNE